MDYVTYSKSHTHHALCHTSVDWIVTMEIMNIKPLENIALYNPLYLDTEVKVQYLRSLQLIICGGDL